jgi:hypothetical protein
MAAGGGQGAGCRAECTCKASYCEALTQSPISVQTQHGIPGGRGAELPKEWRWAMEGPGVLGNSAALKDVGRGMAVPGPTDSCRVTPPCSRGRASVSQMEPTRPGSREFAAK